MDSHDGKQPRPPGEEMWTDEQWRAIKQDGHHILVTAGAGAGKTMVLIKRLLELIGRGTAPLEVDRLLVVTFTNAAAAEMKARLAMALEKAVAKEPRSPHLRRQLLLLNKAQICTVHSFCLEVIREYYHLIELDPSFRLLDEEESLLLQQEVMEDLLEEYYADQEPDSPFYRLVESRSNVYGDHPLQDLILSLYRFAWSHPSPEIWLEKKAAVFVAEAGTGTGVARPWLNILREDCRHELEKMSGFLQLAREIAGQPGGPAPYRQSLDAEINMFAQALQTSICSWEALAEAVQNISFAPLKPCRGTDYDPVLRSQAADLRKRCKRDLKKLIEQLFSRTLEEQEEELGRLAPLIKVLVELVGDFHRRYLAVKGGRGMADFNDLEHYALQILRRPDSPPGQYLPSPAALSYRRRFAAVLVDEYQDINQLQETIIALVANETPGNMFMVGDVKQSIYRFRLAEPELFIQKHHRFSDDPRQGEVIPLTYNFRSRAEVVDAVNFLFQQLMDEDVGEIAYDGEARLRCGAFYPPSPVETDLPDPYATEMLLITDNEPLAMEGDREISGPLPSADGHGEGGLPDGEGTEVPTEEDEWEMATLEGRLIARRIKEMRGEKGGRPFIIYDKKTGRYRPPAYRDMVILLRSYKNCAPVILEELQRCDIPAYAELATGYFAATEVEVMLSLLRIIDNPYQDIPLAAVLRSPLVGLRGEELAAIRIASPHAPFYDALKRFAASSAEDVQHKPWREKLQLLLQRIYTWREKARQDSLGALIWQIYEDSGYYELLGGMPGGRQRQANLRALYDRARQFEATSFRGLSRFLHFIERLRGRGSDLGAARALGEQEDVVRLISVHKSKGLEFPVVFIAGLSRNFNMQDLRRDFLLHRELGFGPKFINTELRLSYPTLPWLALKKRLHLELLAEELRILYVALTRAEQKLVLVAAVRDLLALVQQWELQTRRENLLLPVFERARAHNFLDWLGPALLRHPQAEPLKKMARQPGLIHVLPDQQSTWEVKVVPATTLYGEEAALRTMTVPGIMPQLDKIAHLERVADANCWGGEIDRRLGWSYLYPSATRNFAKLSVSALQRLPTAGFQGEDGRQPGWMDHYRPAISMNPRFLTDSRPDAAARGTAYHTVMQCLDLSQPLNNKAVEYQLAEMVRKEQLTPQEQEIINPRLVTAFFQHPLGQRLLTARRVWRELPFVMTLPATELYPAWQGEEEQVFIQGVIDCLFKEEDGLVIIDYKYGGKRIGGPVFWERYFHQLCHYVRAVEKIREEPVKEAYLYFISRQEAMKVDPTWDRHK